MRRDFQLRAVDVQYLNTSGYAWEAIRAGEELWIVIHDYPIPSGYNVAEAQIALKIEATYPATQIDMAYFQPALSRTDKVAIPAVCDMALSADGAQWQRWSRHRTSDNPWIADEDGVETHMMLVHDWLKREFERRPAP